MILISHRGNTNRVDDNRENTRSYIQEAIDRGFDVEIDIWYFDNKFWLGHDKLEKEVSINWILKRKSRLWIHCKNFKALTKLIDTELRVFYHKKEAYVVISDKHIWAHNLKSVDDKCIIPLLDKNKLENWKRRTIAKSSEVYGICSDYVGLWND